MVKTEEYSMKRAMSVYAGRESLLTLTLQYVYQTVRLGGCGHPRAGDIGALASRAIRDFEALGAALSKEFDPVFTACPPYPVSYHSAQFVDYAKTFPRMLEADIRLEREIAARLGELARSASHGIAACAAALCDSALLAVMGLEELAEAEKVKKSP